MAGAIATDIRKQLQELQLSGVKEEGCELGRGAYGVVMEVTVNGLRCAAKKLHPILLETNSAERAKVSRQFAEECLQHSRLRHPNIVQMIGVYFPSHQAELPLMVMELMEMSLSSRLENEPHLSITTKNGILMDVARALLHLHNQNPPIIHRDLTANNILLTSHLVAKISDLGVAKIVTHNHHSLSCQLTKQPGTTAYMPPEASSSSYDTKLDVFSFGVLTLHVITNEWPLPDAEFVESPEKKGVYHKVSEADRRKKYIDEMGSEHPHKQLVCLCLNNDSDARPSSQTILSDLESIASKTDLLSTQEHKMPKKGTPILIASLQETLEELKSLHMVKATCLIKDAIDNFIKKSNELKTPLNEIKDDLYTMNELLSESELRWSLNRADELTIYSLPDNAIELHAHAFISRKDAEKLLLQDGLRAGTFLIRQSESRPDNYSLSVRDAGSLVCHYRIFSSKPVRQGKLYFIVPRAMFNSLDTLVQHYKKQPDGLCCQLTDPCPALPTTAAIVPPRETKNDWEIEQSYHQALYNLSKSV